jgi:uncharacterized protein YndB with AHSA1/START domain
MPAFTMKRNIEAPIERVWEILDDFGGISQWSPGVKSSELTSEGPVAEGSTRSCDFSPMGAVNERVDAHIPNKQLTVNIFETSKLPISNAVADFKIASHGEHTELTLDYSYTMNRLGSVMKGTTHKQMMRGIGGLADALKEASEKVAPSI